MPPEQYRGKGNAFLAERIVAAPGPVLKYGGKRLCPDGTKGISGIDEVQVIPGNPAGMPGYNPGEGSRASLVK